MLNQAAAMSQKYYWAFTELFDDWEQLKLLCLSIYHILWGYTNIVAEDNKILGVTQEYHLGLDAAPFLKPEATGFCHVSHSLQV